jgi:HEPN domain-containing protein
MNIGQLLNQWMEYSRRDLESAKYLTDMKPKPLEIICFHCQQSTEKALKAFLYFQNIKPPRTHDLDELISLCSDDRIESLRESLIPLNDYSVMVRYPSIESVEDRDADEAIKIAEEAFTIISKITGF